MKECLVAGCGRMGRGIATILSQDIFDYEVTVVDDRPESLEDIPDDIHCENSYYEDIDISKYDIVIGALPYFELYTLATKCINANVHYCDLGGSVPVSKKINEYAKEHADKSYVFTDLGLAPGLINILAIEELKNYGKIPESVKLFVGGLPVNKNINPLGWLLTWSPDGLINEYFDSCEILQNNEIIEVPGMSGYESYPGGLEAFYTSGGAAHILNYMKDIGVKNCEYRTIRYSGHRDLIHFLKYKAKLSDNKIIKIAEGCNHPGEKDIIHMWIVFDDEFVHSGTIESGFINNESFSAMQLATTTPLCVVASLMTQGKFENYGPLKYEDIDFDDFMPLMLKFCSSLSKG